MVGGSELLRLVQECLELLNCSALLFITVCARACVRACVLLLKMCYSVNHVKSQI